MLRRFLETSRRAEIVALLNAAHTETEIAGVAVHELAQTLEAEVVFLLAVDPRESVPVLLGQTGLDADQSAAVGGAPLLRAALRESRARLHGRSEMAGLDVRRLVVSPWTAGTGRPILIAGARLYDEAFLPSEVALLEATTENVGRALERAWLAAERDQHAARQAALVRAAKALNASLVRDEVLQTLCEEISGALQADVVAVYFAHENGGLRTVAGRGVPRETLGGGQPEDAPGASVIRSGRAEILNPRDDDADVDLGLRGVTGVRCGLAVPARHRSDVDGALVVGFNSPRLIVASDVELLAGFAELAGMAYRNANEHTAVRRAATLDSLTGCLNHGAFQSRLREETARAERTRRPLTLISMDVDQFKSVNDRLGHLTGDVLLRTLADVLRDAVRAYDQVGRVGGDEFMLLLPATEEQSAQRVLDRARAALAAARLPGGAAITVSSGLAVWRPGEDASHLLERADRALLEAKAARPDRSKHLQRAEWSVLPGAATEGEGRVHLERLVMAGTLGTRLARLLDERAIVEAAIADLHDQLGYERCLIVQVGADGILQTLAAARPETESESESGLGGAQPSLAARRAAAGRRPILVNDLVAGASGIRSELAVPVFVSSKLWGAITLQSSATDAFERDDAELLQRVADHVGSALRTADLYRDLEEAYLGTAAALAAALEAKDLYTADHARSIAELAVRVGHVLGLGPDDLRDLRYGALFHDIGKIAIPDAILNKRGMLDEVEMRVIREHPLVGERILAPVAFLSRIRRIVRHDHERWDGAGYPDGLRGEEIPLGARIVFVVDAFHAMTSDRPYRQAMSQASAREEMQEHAGTQFDPDVVRTLFAALDSP